MSSINKALEPLMTTTTTAPPPPTPEQIWEYQAGVANADGKYDRLAQCETQGNWHMTGSRYSGGVGFANTSWTQFHLDGMPPNAGQATKAEQIVVAERIRWELAPHGSFRGGKWGCAPTVGLP
jgi:hypothetical protein